MIEPPTKKLLKKDWILTAEAFEDLLKNFDPDREKASLIYEEIRKRLIRQFKAGNSLVAEEHADEVFNRIARKIFENGFILDRTNPYPYFHQTARYVLLEYQRRKSRKMLGLDDLSLSEEPAFDPIEALKIVEGKLQKELGLDALKQCREKLTEREIVLLDRYNLIAGKDKKVQRERLANDSGKTVNALKISINRIRNKLIECTKRKLKLLHF